MGVAKKGMGTEEFVAEHLSGAARRSFYNWAAGRNIPQTGSHAELEQALGWKPGAVVRILANVFVTDKDVYPPDLDAIARKAANLSDEELLDELGRRVREARGRDGL